MENLKTLRGIILYHMESAELLEGVSRKLAHMQYNEKKMELMETKLRSLYRGLKQRGYIHVFDKYEGICFRKSIIAEKRLTGLIRFTERYKQPNVHLLRSAESGLKHVTNQIRLSGDRVMRAWELISDKKIRSLMKVDAEYRKEKLTAIADLLHDSVVILNIALREIDHRVALTLEQFKFLLDKTCKTSHTRYCRVAAASTEKVSKSLYPYGKEVA